MSIHTAPQATGVRPAGDPAARPSASPEIAIASYVAAMTLLLWGRNGGASELLSGGTAALLSAGRLTGLLAALAALAGVFLVARPRHLERAVGLDGMLVLHRLTGITTVALVVVHAVADTLGWGLAAGVNPLAELVTMLRSERWMVAALVGSLLMLTVGITSWRAIKRRMSYEAWYFLHLTGYLAVLLAFGHQVTMGSDIATGAGLWWWMLLFIASAATIAWCRCADLVRALHRGPVSIVASRRLTSDVTEITVSGRGLSPAGVTPGQFFGLRLLGPDTWWQVHPYSVVACGEAGLRFAVKALGDGSSALAEAPVGSRLFLEGPYGVFTADAARDRRVVLIAGGIGVAPIRALLQECTPEQQPVVIVRATDRTTIPYLAELEELAAKRGGTCHVLAGPRRNFAGGQPFRPDVLTAAVPDIGERHVFVCGPTSLEEAVVRSLRTLGLPSGHVHRQRLGC
jgi:predicted ferric reductase